MAVVVVRSGRLAGRRIAVDADVSLGRENTDVVLEDDDEVSRRHAVVRPTADGIEIEDLGSTNGTFVNERLIESPTALDPGDWIRIGQTTIEVEAPRAADTVVTEIPADLKDRTVGRPAPAEDAKDLQDEIPTAALPSREVERTAGSRDHRDPRLWVAAVVLIVLAVAAYLLFFGGDDFAAAADDVCSPAAERVEALDLDSGGNPARLSEDLVRLRRIRSATERDLEKLDPPDDADKFFAAFNNANHVLKRFTRLSSRPVTAASRQWSAARQEYLAAAEDERRAARDLDLGSCARLTGL